jgi:hypothetical protein
MMQSNWIIKAKRGICLTTAGFLFTSSLKNQVIEWIEPGDEADDESRVYAFLVDHKYLGLMHRRWGINGIDGGKLFSSSMDYFCTPPYPYRRWNFSPRYITETCQEYLPVYLEMLTITKRYWGLEKRCCHTSDQLERATIENEMSRIKYFSKDFKQELRRAYGALESLRRKVEAPIEQPSVVIESIQPPLDLTQLKHKLNEARSNTTALQAVSKEFLNH